MQAVTLCLGGMVAASYKLLLNPNTQKKTYGDPISPIFHALLLGKHPIWKLDLEWTKCMEGWGIIRVPGVHTH